MTRQCSSSQGNSISGIPQLLYSTFAEGVGGGSPSGQRRHRSRPSIAAPGRHPCGRGVRGFHPSVTGAASRSFHPRPSSRREPSPGGAPSILSARSAPVGAVRRQAWTAGGVSVQPSRPSSSVPAIHHRAGSSFPRPERRRSPSVRRRHGVPFHLRSSSRREPSPGGVQAIPAARSATVGAVRHQALAALADRRPGRLPARCARSSFFPRCCLLRVRNPIT